MTWLRDNGAVADLIRTRDWSKHSLGHPEQWPDTLRSSLNLILASPLPMNLLWGSERVVLYNDAYAEFIGALHPQMFSLPVDVALPHSPAQMREARARAFQGERLNFPDEHIVIHRGGTQDPVWISVSYTPVFGPTGSVEGVLVIVIDVTQVRQQQIAVDEAKLAAEAANIAKSEFLATMSHEIRTPLNAIIGISHILSRASSFTTKLQELIPTLRLSADSLLALVDDLLDISKIESQAITLDEVSFSLATLAHEVASILALRAQEKHLTLETEVSDVEGISYLGDPTRIRQMILNLCSNAIKFTETGKIVIKIERDSTSPSPSNWIAITIQDTGIGIPKEKIDLIFQKFVQADASINRKYGGTGLGLSISKRLAELMGGEISVTSEVGKGSIFKVRFPLSVSTEEKDAMAGILDCRGLRPRELEQGPVLLVEDYEPNILVAQIFLEDLGYKVEIAKTGAEAIAKVKSTRFSIILMDFQMAGISGLDATEAIRAFEQETKTAPVPIMGLTAHALAGDKEKCLAAGMDDYISKPFNPDELASKMKKLLTRMA